MKLLDQLRTEYQRNEAEIKAPLENEVTRLNNNYVELRKEKNRIAKLATTEFGKAILREILAQFSHYLEMEFVKLMPKVGTLGDEVLTFQIPASYLRYMRYGEFENYCLEQYCQHAEENVDFAVSDGIIDKKMQIVTVMIPKLTIRREVVVDELK